MLRKLNQFDRRKRRVRRSLAQVPGGRPRLSVFRSSKHIYAQVIDDARGPHGGGRLEPGEGPEGAAQDRCRQGGGCRGRQAAGRAGAARPASTRWCSIAAAIRYHGRIKALADGAREGGLSF